MRNHRPFFVDIRNESHPLCRYIFIQSKSFLNTLHFQFVQQQLAEIFEICLYQYYECNQSNFLEQCTFQKSNKLKFLSVALCCLFLASQKD